MKFEKKNIVLHLGLDWLHGKLDRTSIDLIRIKRKLDVLQFKIKDGWALEQGSPGKW